MKKAFTLIELLVTIVLFSLLLATALYSFNFITINIRNINNTNPKEAIYYDLLRRVIGSIYYYVELDETIRDKNKRYYHYFKGTQKDFYFITTSSLYSERMVIAHLKYEKRKLIYEEEELFKKEINYLKLEDIIFSKKKTIFSELKEMSFSYYYDNKEHKSVYRRIPKMITIKVKNNKVSKRYIFKIQANNDLYIENIRNKNILNYE